MGRSSHLAYGRLAEHTARERIRIEYNTVDQIEERPPHPSIEAVIVAIAVDIETTQYRIDFVENRFLQRSGARWRSSVGVANAQIAGGVRPDKRLVNGDPVAPARRTAKNGGEQTGISQWQPDVRDVPEDLERGDGDAPVIFLEIDIAAQVHGPQGDTINRLLQRGCGARAVERLDPCVGQYFSSRISTA